METINPYIETKICRLCGSNDKENIDIFASKPISSRSTDLLTKILTVYPLVLYKGDPLPQNICPKCIGNVSTTYQDIQQVMRQQNKWMSITKAVQPEHKYFRILNVVENSTKATKETIKTSYDIELNNIPIGKLLGTTLEETINTTVNKVNIKANMNDNVVKNIQSKLESNGFTIKRIKVSSAIDNKQDIRPLPDSKDFNRTYVSTNANIETCNYCKQKFSDPKELAQHQLIHLKLSANKVFEKHLLSKHLRRGRLITLNDSKYIRCLNCWRIFKDNKSILQHWSDGDCEFYCVICGKEYHHSPKMLREHVTEVHGISYRSARIEFMNSLSPHIPPSFVETKMKAINIYPPPTLNVGMAKKVAYKKPPPKSCTKNDDGTITCKICHKVFDNFRSSNSHMRKHKPPARFKDPVKRSSMELDSYNTQDDYMEEPSTSNFGYDNTKQSISTATNLSHIKAPRPPYRVIMKNGPLRGIKTKIVQKRHDFLSNYANNDHHSTQRPISSTSDTNDDENLIVPELLMPAKSEYTSSPLIPSIKSEPLDNSEYVESQEPRLCFICNESFLNNRDYELHAMFVHNIN